MNFFGQKLHSAPRATLSGWSACQWASALYLVCHARPLSGQLASEQVNLTFPVTSSLTSTARLGGAATFCEHMAALKCRIRLDRLLKERPQRGQDFSNFSLTMSLK